jgi:pullulanase/glycogen debranching enzyme
MRKGELSSETLPRVYVVFENLIGLLPSTKDRIAEQLARKRKKWEQAADYYQLNIHTAQGIRDLYWRQRFRVDIVTFIDPGFVSAIRNKLDSRNLLFGDVHYYDQETLMADLTYDPAVIAVLDPDPSRLLTWGSKGKYCSSDQINLLNLIM